MSTPPPLPHPEAPYVVVKFNDDIGLPYNEDAAGALEARHPGSWSRVSASFPRIRLRPMFASVPVSRIRELVETAMGRDRSYRPPDFTSYFIVDYDQSIDVDKLIETLRSVLPADHVYFDPHGEDPAVPAFDNPQFTEQGYLRQAPEGIGAEFAWTFTGGAGEGLEFIDLEKGWTLDHEDLVDQNAQNLHGDLQNGSRRHGTAVLAEVCAVDNDAGVVGVAPKVGTVNVVSYYNSNRPAAIMAAIGALEYGSVLLLEAQLPYVSNGTVEFYKLPIEVQQADFDVIRLATALGIVVVAAAGNGKNDLNQVTDYSGKFVLDPSHPDYRDSGAILVGAATSGVPHSRLAMSNFGDRVDCYAWGENVTTADSSTAAPFDTDTYQSCFDGTSAAAPMVAGAALVVQGIAENNYYFRFSAFQIRELLSSPANGTASKDPAVDRIGVMPDLKKLLLGPQIGLAPDLYLRDFVGDDGRPHAGAISASPDIIVRPAPVADPQAAFGAGSGTENSDMLGHQSTSGQDNYVYVRVRNRGGSAAADATAHVYWAPVSTLPLPDTWTPVGSAYLPAVPGADVLTVFDAIRWPAASIPPPGHYCFVAVVGSATDPVPQLATGMSWAEFRRIVRDNNNVTWRNFNVVDIASSQDIEPTGFAAMEFFVPGAPDARRRMRIEVGARLPSGSEVLLELPRTLDRHLSYRPPSARGANGARDTVRIPMNPHGQRALDVDLKQRARYRLRLLVHVPERHRSNAYDLFVRQVDEELEVGRVTFRLEAARQARRAATDITNMRGSRMKLIEAVSADLEAAGFTKHQIAVVNRAFANNLPRKTYVLAVYFLGAITAVLVLGALVLAGLGRGTDAIWVAVGAGIGGLAGIFAPKD